MLAAKRAQLGKLHDRIDRSAFAGLHQRVEIIDERTYIDLAQRTWITECLTGTRQGSNVLNEIWHFVKEGQEEKIRAQELLVWQSKAETLASQLGVVSEVFKRKHASLH